MSLVKILKEFNIHNNIKEFKQFLEDNGIRFDKEVDYYIGSGAMGDVYKVKGTNKVIKIWEATQAEFELNKKIMEYSKKGVLLHVAEIFFLKKIDDELFLSVMEYLEEPDWDHDVMMSALTFLEIYYYDKPWERKNYTADELKMTAKDSYRGDLNLDFYFKKIEVNYRKYQTLYMTIMTVLSKPQHYRLDKYDALIEKYAHDPKVFVDVFKGIKEFEEKIGQRHNDVHSGNVLIDPYTKDYKLIDARAV